MIDNIEMERLLFQSELQTFQVISIGQDNGNCVAVSGRFDLIRAEGQQLLTCFDFIAVLDEGLESVAAHTNGINTDMDQHFHSVSFQGHSMFGIEDHGHGSVERSYNNIFTGLDTDTLSQNTGSKSIVRNLFHGDHFAGNRLKDFTST